MNSELLFTIDQILFIILPLFIYKIFILDKPAINPVLQFIAMVVCCSVSMITSMAIPLIEVKGYIIDLRVVAFSIGFLYGGYRVGIALMLVTIGYRYYIGGDGFYATLVLQTILSMALIPLSRNFLTRHLNFKLAIGAFIGVLYSSLVMIWFYIAGVLDQDVINFPFFIQFTLTLILSLFSVTYVIEMMRKNASIREEIHHWEKLKMVSEIAASVSHEVRNPLTVIRGFIQLLARGQVREDKKQEYYLYIMEELNRAQVIITDYLNFAKPQTSQVEEIKVMENINYVVGVLTPYAVIHNVELVVSGEREVAIRGDRLKLRQCLLNIIKNGIEATRSEGIVSITQSLKEEQVIIKITDTGVGMDSKQLKRLGSIHVSIKENGTGLGTRVVYSIVQSMGGTIEVQSKRAEGTSFTLSFPRIDHSGSKRK
ncbi:ATP-binding protein [Paenibacillus abyssi]|uniref:histidine kinase n=2 Tax=Paenibacillus abyssi TaxID=1340531 RepID=A0A917LDM5_9BACL|nr:sensor histidine kinase [Paenibacillus abyssi]GGG14895.1 sensor histidine kinase [Paenibacillus abyssi]